MTAHYALIGYPLSHSFSPTFFNKKFHDEGIDAVYESHPLPHISDFPAWLHRHPKLRGINVTIPYKETVIPYLDEVDPVAVAIGAVNCIAVNNGHTKGYNTDAKGFEESLLLLLGNRRPPALVLGTGGASKAVGYVLRRLGIPFVSVSRNPNGETISYNDVTEAVLRAHPLIINTTPLGMYPAVDTCPQLQYGELGREHVLFDLVYNPPVTRFMQHGIAAGAVAQNGLDMLHRQAIAGWEIWNQPKL